MENSIRYLIFLFCKIIRLVKMSNHSKFIFQRLFVYRLWQIIYRYRYKEDTKRKWLVQYFANSTNLKSIKTMRRSFKKGKKLFTSRFSGEQSASVEGKLSYIVLKLGITRKDCLIFSNWSYTNCRNKVDISTSIKISS